MPDVTDTVTTKNGATATAIEYVDHQGRGMLKLDQKVGNKQWHYVDDLTVAKKGEGIGHDVESTTPAPKSESTTPKTVSNVVHSIGDTVKTTVDGKEVEGVVTRVGYPLSAGGTVPHAVVTSGSTSTDFLPMSSLTLVTKGPGESAYYKAKAAQEKADRAALKAAKAAAKSTGTKVVPTKPVFETTATPEKPVDHAVLKTAPTYESMNLKPGSSTEPWHIALEKWQDKNVSSFDPDFVRVTNNWQKGSDQQLRSASKQILKGKAGNPEARSLMKAVANSPANDVTLHRGIGVTLTADEVVKKYAKGSTFDEPMSSFSTSRSVAKDFMTGAFHHDLATQNVTGVSFELKSGAKTLPIWQMSGMREKFSGKKRSNTYISSEMEHIAGGRFRVVSTEVSSGTHPEARGNTTVHIVLEHIGVFDVS